MKDVAASLKAKIAAGLLPIPAGPPGQVWVGNGNGRACDVCDGEIPASELEYEVDVAPERSLRFHQKCLAAWHQARTDHLTE